MLFFVITIAEKKYFDERVLNFSSLENFQQGGLESFWMKIRTKSYFLNEYSPKRGRVH